MPKVLAISDLHGRLPRSEDGRPDVPPCDVFILGGDLCPDYNSNIDNGEAQQANWLNGPFREWLEDVRTYSTKNIVAIAGNHDFVFERRMQPDLPWTYLQDQGVTLAGVSIYGIPWCPRLSRWAFHGDDRKLRASYEAVPEDVDVLVSHSPPHGYGDHIPPSSPFNSRKYTINVGTRQLTNILYEKRPRTVVCGHIHEARGRWEYHSNGTVIYNVAYITELYEPYPLESCTDLRELADSGADAAS